MRRVPPLTRHPAGTSMLKACSCGSTNFTQRTASGARAGGLAGCWANAGAERKSGSARTAAFGIDMKILRRLERAGDLFDLEALDDVAFFDVVVILEGHAAFEAFTDFADFVLEALERLQRAFVDDDVIT